MEKAEKRKDQKYVASVLTIRQGGLEGKKKERIKKEGL